MAQGLSAQPMPKSAGKHNVDSQPKRGSRMRQDDKERLSTEDKAALEEIMKGKADVTRHNGREYLKKIRAALDEQA